MSTRRARIKGVAILSKKRKNVSLERNPVVSPIGTVSPEKSQVRAVEPTTFQQHQSSIPTSKTAGPWDSNMAQITIDEDTEMLEQHKGMHEEDGACSKSPCGIENSDVEDMEVELEIQLPTVGIYEGNSSHKPLSPEKQAHEETSSTPEENIVDGIVPLKRIDNKMKPMDLLKSEMISDAVQVSFDPIVPLPSPTRARPKLRPAPRLPPRHALFGGVGEADACASEARAADPPAALSHGAVDAAIPQSPFVEKKSLKKGRDVSRRAAAQRRHTGKSRSQLTMGDLLYYNPTTNPPARKPKKEVRSLDTIQEVTVTDSAEGDKGESAPVPLVKIGPHGDIVLDEQSLVVAGPGRGGGGGGGAAPAPRGAYRRSARAAAWSAAETVRFYRAVAALGTDFTLMAPLFPHRPRTQLKKKFKKEEKINPSQIDQALRSVANWDSRKLLEDFEQERRQEETQRKTEEIAKLDAKRAQDEHKRERLKRRAAGPGPRAPRLSKAARALGEAAQAAPTAHVDGCASADDLLEMFGYDITALSVESSTKPLDLSSVQANPPKALRTYAKTRPVPKKLAVAGPVRTNSVASVAKQASPMASAARRASPLASTAQRASPLASTAQRASPLVSTARRASPLVSTARRASPLVSVAQQASPLVSAARRASPLASTAQRASPLASTAQRASPLASTAQRASPLVSTAQRASPLASTAQRASPLASTAQRASPLVSTARRASPLVSVAQQASPLVSAARRASPLASAAQSSVSIAPAVASPNLGMKLEPGSVVMLTTSDAKSPYKKAFHAYVSDKNGTINSIVLDPSVMTSLVTYIKADSANITKL